MAELTIDLLLEDAKFKTELDAAVARAGVAGKKIGTAVEKPTTTALSNIASVASGFLVGSVLLQLPSILTRAFSTVTAAAIKQEDAVNDLNSALKRTGGFSEAASTDLQRFASELQSVSIVGDEVILKQIAYAKSLGLSNAQTKEFVTAALNLSAALGKDFGGSLQQLLKTLSGLQGEIGESLPAIRELTAEQLRSGEAAALVNKQFQNAYVTQTNTTSGSLQQLSNSFGDLTEKLGNFIIKSNEGKATINTLTQAFNNLNLELSSDKKDNLKALRIDISNLSRETLLLKKSREELGNVRTPEALAIDDRISRNREEMAELRAEYTALKGDLSAESPVKDIAKESAKVLELTRQQREQLSTRIKELGLSETQLEIQRFEESQALLKEAFENRLLTESEYFARRNELRNQQEEIDNQRRLKESEQVAAEEQKRRDALLNAQFDFQNFANNTDTIFSELAKQFEVTNKDIAIALIQGIGGGAGNAFAAFGAALVNGENALTAFTKVFMQAIGEQAVALGTKFILEGAAISFSPTSGGPAVGVPLIAKGAALATFGGVLGAISTGESASTSTSATSSTGSSIYEPADDLSTETAEEREAANTGVTINIQGDVFDSEDTGLRIANILENSSLNDNVRIVGALA